MFFVVILFFVLFLSLPLKMLTFEIEEQTCSRNCSDLFGIWDLQTQLFDKTKTSVMRKSVGLEPSRKVHSVFLTGLTDPVQVNKTCLDRKRKWNPQIYGHRIPIILTLGVTTEGRNASVGSKMQYLTKHKSMSPSQRNFSVYKSKVLTHDFKQRARSKHK